MSQSGVRITLGRPAATTGNNPAITTTATLNTGGAALVGIVAGDTVSLSTAGATGAFGTATVGTAKTVNVSGLTISGADSGNYSLTQPTTTADITAKVLTVTGITASNKIYDATTSATVDGIRRGKAVVYTPPIWQLIMLIVRHLPRPIFNRLPL